MAQKYKSIWTGPQVDEAVGNVSKKIDKDSLIGSNGVIINKTDSTIEISGVELVKKTAETNKVYGTDSAGEQALKPFASTPTPAALATYDDVSNLKTSAPIEDSDCANKKYVDDAVSSASSSATPITFETVEQFDNYVKTSASAKKGQIASVLNTTEQRAYLIIAVGE